MNDQEKYLRAQHAARHYDVVDSIRDLTERAANATSVAVIGECAVLYATHFPNDAPLNILTATTALGWVLSNRLTTSLQARLARLQLTTINETGFDPADELPLLDDIFRQTEPTR